MASTRLNFGGRKYAAFNLMVARWLSSSRNGSLPLRYVTMGGTELQDVLNFCWANQPFVDSIISYENNVARFTEASATANQLKSNGLSIAVQYGDIFDYRREDEMPHVFFVDLMGQCSLGQYRDPLRDWFRENTFRPGDFLLMTSYLGRNSGWKRTLEPFRTEFGMLGLGTEAEQRTLYEKMHPAFVLHRALIRAHLADELKIDCLGYVRYRDTSPMGLYGFVCGEGETDLLSLVNKVPFYNTINKQYSLQTG